MTAGAAGAQPIASTLRTAVPSPSFPAIVWDLLVHSDSDGRRDDSDMGSDGDRRPHGLFSLLNRGTFFARETWRFFGTLQKENTDDTEGGSRRRSYGRTGRSCSSKKT